MIIHRLGSMYSNLNFVNRESLKSRKLCIIHKYYIWSSAFKHETGA